MRGKYKVVAFGAVILGFAAMAGAYTIIPIDTFTAGNPNLELGVAGTVDSTENSLSGVIGQQRYTSMQVVTQGTGTSCKASVGSGVMNFASDSGFVANWELIYGNGTDLNQDFGVASGNDRVRLDWTSGTLSGATVRLTLVSDNGGGSSATQTLSKVTAGGSECMEYLFSDFDLIDFSDIDRVQIRVEGNTSWDGAIKSGTFVVIPEPGMMALLGLGGVVLMLRRRKRQA